MSSVPSPIAANVPTSELFTGGSVSVQLMFAQLQLTLCQANKDKAMEKMDTIKENQTLAKETAEVIAIARAWEKGESNATAADKKILGDFIAAHNIRWFGSEAGGTWEGNIKSLTNFQEQIGTDTQQLMVFIQDFMGQYNSYLQGANSAIQQSNQTLTTIARGQ